MTDLTTPKGVSRAMEEAVGTLLTTQHVVDTGLTIAAILVALADGKDPEKLGFSHEDAVHMARGLVGSQPNVRQASYLYEDAMRDVMESDGRTVVRRPSRGGMLRVVSGYYNTDDV